MCTNPFTATDSLSGPGWSCPGQGLQCERGEKEAGSRLYELCALRTSVGCPSLSTVSGERNPAPRADLRGSIPGPPKPAVVGLLYCRVSTVIV